MDPRVERIYAAADYIKQQLGGRKPLVGIILGSGLGRLATAVENPLIIPYKTVITTIVPR